MLAKIKIVFAILLGFLVLFPACLMQAWTPASYASIKPNLWENDNYRPFVDLWKWKWLNYWYANVEDGVSGRQAYIWIPDKLEPGHFVLVPYVQTFWYYTPEWVIAYCWSAWRNNADNLKRANFDPPLNKTWP